MKEQLFILILLLGVSKNSLSQIMFQKTFVGSGDDFGNSVQQTTDGGYIITGSISNSNENVCLIKTDANGDTLWTKTFGGAGDDAGNSVQQTTDGGYIITGEYDYGTGISNVYLIKTNASGDSLWTKTFGGFSHEEGYSVYQTTDGGYIIVGTAGSFLGVYLIKIDNIGGYVWSKSFGGPINDLGASVQQTTDGGYIITGYTDGFSAGGDADIYLIKTNANGDSLWIKNFGGTGDDRGYSVRQTADGGYIIAGYSHSYGAGSEDVYLVKTDANGGVVWTKTYGGTIYDRGLSVQQTTDGGYIITGYTQSFGAGNKDFFLVKTDMTGNSLWTKTFGGTDNDYGNSVQQTVDGGYIIIGTTKSFGSGNYDIYLIKTDSNGNTGCNQGNPLTIETSPITQVSSVAPFITLPNTNVNIPATIAGSGGIVTTLCTSVGINQFVLDKAFFNISPNPSKGSFIISFEGITLKGNIEILNTFGEGVFVENIFNESKKRN